MIIDTFQDVNFYKDLETNVNPIIVSTLKKYFFFDESNLSQEDKQHRDYLISWFDPDNLWKNCLPCPYDNDVHFRKNPQFNLQIHYPTYIFLHVVNNLYNNRKNVLIEDVCCGIGRTEIYLNYLGFTNLHLIDDFSQIKDTALLTMLKEAKVAAPINQSNMNPIISYISGLPYFPKDVNNSIELFCHYTNPHMTKTLTPILKNKGFVHLCTDTSHLMRAWCKSEKHAEFSTKLKKYEV